MDSTSVQPATSHLWRCFWTLSVFCSCFICLYTTMSDYGITWDEAETNFPAARRQAEWFHLFFQGSDVFNEEGVRTYFETESDHPSLPRSCMAVSRLLVPANISDRTAFALPTCLLVSLFALFFFILVWKRSGIGLALFGTFVLFTHPHWFGHAHFAEYDILVAIAWFVAAILFYTAIDIHNIAEVRSSVLWFRAFLAALALGLAVSVKVHSMFLPFPLVVWALLFRRWNVWRWCLLCAFLVPAIYIATQPYLWWHTIDRITNRFHDYGTKLPINVYYFGRLYSGNVPWHYAWVMLLATLPVGLAVPFLFWLAGICGRFIKAVSCSSNNSCSWISFLVLNGLTLPLIFSLKSPYDGLRFFLSTLPFLTLLAIAALEQIEFTLQDRWGPSKSHYLVIVLCLLLTGIQVHTCWRIYPYHLSYYSFLVGGVHGANNLGLESTYWCDAVTPGFIHSLVEKVPPNARIATHAMDAPPLLEYQKMGVLPSGWCFQKDGPVDCRILQFRQGFFGPMEVRLALERKPLVESEIDGVPLARAYTGP